MPKLNLTRKLFTIHSWLGLFLGLLYLLISVSGASVVFVNEITQWVYGDSLKVVHDPEIPRLSFDDLYAVARREYRSEGYLVVGYDAAHPENAGTVAGVESRPHNIFTPNLRYQIGYVDPATKDVFFRTSSGGKNDFFHWLVGFHDSFQLGGAGELFVALTAVTALLSVVTGLLVYRKYLFRMLLFRVKIDLGNWRKTTSSLHRLIGTWALVVNIFIFFSGVYLYKDYFTTRWWRQYTEQPQESTHQILNYPPATTSLDSIAVKAQHIVPDMILESISIAADSSRTISAVGPMKEKLFLGSDNYAVVDFNFDGTLKQNETKRWDEMSFSEKFDNINFNLLHTGWALGVPGKIIWTIVGFTPALLSLTGFMLWWRQKSRKNSTVTGRASP